MPLIVAPITNAFIAPASDLVLADLGRLRQSVPDLPPATVSPELARDRLARLFERRGGLMATLDGQLVGFMSWFIIPDFRGTGRIGACVPEWAHAFAHDRAASTQTALYVAAAHVWTEAGCAAHAVIVPATNTEETGRWFRQGFGLIVVDCVRRVEPLGITPPDGMKLRRATPADSPVIAELDAEQAARFALPPILYNWDGAMSVDDVAAFLDAPGNAIWLAWVGDEPIGFMRFAGDEGGDGSSLASTRSATITGAFVRAASRRHGAGSALLDRGLADLAERGVSLCRCEFETFNADAASFWPRYFTEVTHSVIRYPEHIAPR